MAHRRTVEVSDLLATVNSMLDARKETQSGRIALHVLIETVLMATGNYGGSR